MAFTKTKTEKTADQIWDRFTIGQVGKTPYFTNVALDHEMGRLTNERLMKMTDAELHAIGYSHVEPIPKLLKPEESKLPLKEKINLARERSRSLPPPNHPRPRQEMYRAPSNKAEAERQGLEPGRHYLAVHRAVCILLYRKAAAAERAAERNEINRESLDALGRSAQNLADQFGGRVV